MKKFLFVLMLLAAAFNLPAQTPGNIIYSKDYYRYDTEGIQYYIDADGKLTFESMVTELGNSCFYNNRRIKSVVINKNINRIGFIRYSLYSGTFRQKSCD